MEISALGVGRTLPFPTCLLLLKILIMSIETIFSTSILEGGLPDLLSLGERIKKETTNSAGDLGQGIPLENTDSCTHL